MNMNILSVATPPHPQLLVSGAKARTTETYDTNNKGLLLFLLFLFLFCDLEDVHTQSKVQVLKLHVINEQVGVRHHACR